MKAYQKAKPLGITSLGYPYWSHSADIQVNRRSFRVYCARCGFDKKYPTRSEARDAADGHMIFTHVTGGRLCGNTRCKACLAIKRRESAP